MQNNVILSDHKDIHVERQKPQQLKWSSTLQNPSG